MNLKRMIYLVLGFICLGAGCVGVVLLLLPSFPFFVGTAVRLPLAELVATVSQRINEPDYLANVLSEHQAIYNAFLNEDVEGGATAMEIHMDNSMKRHGIIV